MVILFQIGVAFLRLGAPSRVHPTLQMTTPTHLCKGVQSVKELEQFYSSQSVVATTCLGVASHPIFTRSFPWLSVSGSAYMYRVALVIGGKAIWPCKTCWQGLTCLTNANLLPPPLIYFAVHKLILLCNRCSFYRRTFDVCIIDEASQIPLPICLGPLRHAFSFVLVGDHYQLPPLVVSQKAR